MTMLASSKTNQSLKPSFRNSLFLSLMNFVSLADSIQWISKNVVKRFPFSHLSWLLWAKSNCGQNCQKHFQFQLFLTFSPAHLYLLKPYIVTIRRKSTHEETTNILINLLRHIFYIINTIFRKHHSKTYTFQNSLLSHNLITSPRLGICQKNYMAQFSGEGILHTENASI